MNRGGRAKRDSRRTRCSGLAADAYTTAQLVFQWKDDEAVELNEELELPQFNLDDVSIVKDCSKHYHTGETSSKHYHTGETSAKHYHTGETSSKHYHTGETSSRHHHTGEASSKHYHTGETSSKHYHTGEASSKHYHTGEASSKHDHTGEASSKHYHTGETSSKHYHTGETSSKHDHTGETSSKHDHTGETSSKHDHTGEARSKHCNKEQLQHSSITQLNSARATLVLTRTALNVAPQVKAIDHDLQKFALAMLRKWFLCELSQQVSDKGCAACQGTRTLPE